MDNNNETEVTPEIMQDLFNGFMSVLANADNHSLTRTSSQKFIVEVLTDRHGVSVRMRDALLRVFADSGMQRQYLSVNGQYNNRLVLSANHFATYLTTIATNDKLWVDREKSDKGNLMSLIAGLLLLSRDLHQASRVATAGLEADPRNGLCILILRALNLIDTRAEVVFQNSITDVSLDEILMGSN